MGYSMKTFVFKTIGDFELKADVYSPMEEGRHPAVLWLHGGALILGGRDDIPAEQADFYTRHGYTVVSPDYRLAPETRLDGIIEDIMDVYGWIRKEGPGLFALDPGHIFVAGHSAGGYLALTAGHYMEPRPRALVSFYGYGDIAGAWLNRPDPFYGTIAPVPENQARSSVQYGGQPVVCGGIERYKYYMFCRQNGLWTREVTGMDAKLHEEQITRYCPIAHISKDYPPALLLHGDMDTDVPYAQSVLMAYKLLQNGVDHELLVVRGGGHAFDVSDHPSDAQDGDSDPFRAVLGFLRKHS